MGLINYPSQIRKAKLTYIEVADTCFEGDDRSYRHDGNLILNRDLTRRYCIGRIGTLQVDKKTCCGGCKR
jgi:hypothetical protein